MTTKRKPNRNKSHLTNHDKRKITQRANQNSKQEHAIRAKRGKILCNRRQTRENIMQLAPSAGKRVEA